jgi:hypothetical protein
MGRKFDLVALRPRPVSSIIGLKTEFARTVQDYGV